MIVAAQDVLDPHAKEGPNGRGPALVAAHVRGRRRHLEFRVLSEAELVQRERSGNDARLMPVPVRQVVEDLEANDETRVRVGAAVARAKANAVTLSGRRVDEFTRTFRSPGHDVNLADD